MSEPFSNLDSPRAALPNGTALYRGRYVIEAHLGTGSYGITYCAFESAYQRRIAIKELFPFGCKRRAQKLVMGSDWDEEGLEDCKNSFLEEGHILAGLNHPGIVKVFRPFSQNETLYLAMEYVEGESLADYLGRHEGLLPIDEALAMMQTAGEALSVVHQTHHLHHDLKPGNMMRRRNGEVVLIDFGAARDYIPETIMSQPVVYTEGYAAPEQYDRKGVRGPFTDVYGLAVTLYRLLTGRVPLRVPLRMAKETLAAPQELRPEIPTCLSNAILQALHLNVQERTQTVEAFLVSLNPSVSASPSSSAVTSSLPSKVAPAAPPPETSKSAQITSVPPASESEVSLSAPPTIFVSLWQPPATKINPADGAEMIWIPAGAFRMGSLASDVSALIEEHPNWKPEWFADEMPPHEITLEGYYIYKTPVTAAQYHRFCVAAGRQMPYRPDWGWHEDHPVVNVSWGEAQAYCAWAGVTLPTEAQWEKATRGTDGRKFPWGDGPDGGNCRCSLNERGDAKTTSAVGSYPGGASPYGVLDMAGNVWEWCYDWYEKNYYQQAPASNPPGPSSSATGCRVLRGGSWSDVQDYCRCAIRFRINPNNGYNNYGFRCSSGV